MDEFLAINAVIFLIGFFTVILPVALAYIVYRDASNNNVDVPFIWALVTFFMPFIGILIYFLAVRPGYKVNQTDPIDQTNYDRLDGNRSALRKGKEDKAVKSGPIQRY